MHNVSAEFSCLQKVSGDSVCQSVWSVYQPYDPFDTVAIGYAISAVMILYLLVGLPWNSLVVGIIIKKRLFTQPAVMLILNLAIANFLVYIFVMPFNIVTGIAGEYVFGSSDRVRCRVCQLGVAIVLFALVLTHTLCLMAIDRFIYLKKPLKYCSLVTPRRMLAAIVGVWVLCIVLAVPPLFGFGQIQFSHTVATCIVIFTGATSIAPNYLYVLVLIAEGTVPFVIIFVMYIWILYIIRKFLMDNLRKTLGANGGHHLESRLDILKRHSRSQLHLVQVFSAIFTSNIITWLPLIPLAISAAVLGPGGVPTLVYSLVYLVFMSSTVIHPVLQTYLTREIRVTIKDTFTKLCKAFTKLCKKP